MSGDNDSSTNNPQEANSDVFALLSERDRHAIWARLARPGKVIPKAEPAVLTDFDRTFQALAGPRLESFVAFGGYLVSLELESFSCAHARVMRVARKYGAMHLSDSAFWALDSWIAQSLVGCIDGPAPDGLISPERLALITGEPRQ